MLHESNEKKSIVVKDEGVSFEDIYSKPYITNEIKADIMSANILLIPYEGFRENCNLLFPEITNQFLGYLREEKSNGLNPDIAISDEDFEIIEMHADLTNLPMILVEYAVLPIACSIIASFLFDLIKKNPKKEHKVKIKMAVEETEIKKVKTVEYEGDAENFDDAMKGVIDKLF